MALLPTYFISHGGGPWPYMDEMRSLLRGLELSLQDMPRQLPERPRAVLMVSGHWEENPVAVMSAAAPPMLYDYHGFPEHTYHVVYPAPGAPELAARTLQLLQAAGIPAQADATRGFDHGTFAPMVVMYPQSDVPVFQVSLKSGLDPAEHLAIGAALAPLRSEGVLIVGSGLSFHNLRLMGPAARQPSEAFDAWLQQAVVESAPQQRAARLIDWQRAPAARIAHPREDHLLPLMVAAGAAPDGRATLVYHEQGVFGGMTVSSFRFDG